MLKDETPDYPADLLEARKYDFLKQIIDFKISDGAQGGEHGQQAGGGGQAVVVGKTAETGFSMNVTLVVGILLVLLTAAYLFRDQILDFLADNETVHVQETAAPANESTPFDRVTATPTIYPIPTLGVPSSGIVATDASPDMSDGPDRPQATPGLGQRMESPAASTPNGIAGRLRYLLCVLRRGGDTCK